MKKENSENGGEKAKVNLSALDVFVIVLVLLCVAGAAVRLYAGDSGILPISNPDKEEYVVSFEAAQVNTVLGNYIVSGENLYDGTGNLFGVLGENVTITPAKLYIEDSDGKYVQIYANAENGDSSLVDIRGTVIVSGYFTDYGFFVDGKTYIAPNYDISLHTGKATVNVKITDISKLEGGV